MKKRAGILIPIAVLIIIVLVPLLTLKFTGFLIKEPEQQIQFYFYDEQTNCPLNGYVFIGDKPIGESVNGFFNLTYPNYAVNIANSTQEISIFGILGDCFNEKDLYYNSYFQIPEIRENYFLGDKIFNFSAELTPHNPTKRELQGFVKPELVKQELNKLILTGNTNQDLSYINHYFSESIDYEEDKDNYWQTPEETLNLNQGDCEDYSALLLSFFSAYNSELNCYNIIFSSHSTTFCRFNDYYSYYDSNFELEKQLYNPDKSFFENLNKEYAEELSLNNEVYYAFNDIEFFEFKNNSEFISWQINLKNKKEQINLFQNLENQINQNDNSLPDIKLKGELRTQTISLPNSKNYYLLLIPIALIITAIVFFIIFGKK